jgi:hypothetical protein
MTGDERAVAVRTERRDDSRRQLQGFRQPGSMVWSLASIIGRYLMIHVRIAE